MPSSVCVCAFEIVPPVSVTDGVLLVKEATASLNSTITCGTSFSPVWFADANRLDGNVADRVVAAGAAAISAVAALVSVSLVPLSSVKPTLTLMVLPTSVSVSV